MTRWEALPEEHEPAVIGDETMLFTPFKAGKAALKIQRAWLQHNLSGGTIITVRYNEETGYSNVIEKKQEPNSRLVLTRPLSIEEVTEDILQGLNDSGGAYVVEESTES